MKHFDTAVYIPQISDVNAFKYRSVLYRRKKEFITIRFDGLGYLSQTEETKTVIYEFV